MLSNCLFSAQATHQLASPPINSSSNSDSELDLTEPYSSQCKTPDCLILRWFQINARVRYLWKIPVTRIRSSPCRALHRLDQVIIFNTYKSNGPKINNFSDNIKKINFIFGLGSVYKYSVYFVPPVIVSFEM